MAILSRIVGAKVLRSPPSQWSWSIALGLVLRIVASGFMLAGGLIPQARAQNAPLKEHEVKLAFVYNFLKFVDWPEDAFRSGDSPIVVYVVGKDSFGPELENVFRDKTVGNRRIEAKRVAPSDNLRACNVLFIAPMERRRMQAVFETIDSTSVLTVGETEDFCKIGGIINLINEANKIRFQINVDAARRARLKVHSTLLNLARIYREEPK
jgi:hypothetical protein